MDDSFETCF